MAVCLCAAASIGGKNGTSNANGISVNIDGSPVSFDVEPCIINDRTMVPMRNIFEALGAEVSWDDSSRTVTAQKDGNTIILAEGSYEIYKNGSASAIDSPPVIIDGRTLVPVRAVSDALDVDVSWNEESKTVNISTSKDDAKDDDLWKENTGEIDLDTMTVSGNGVSADGNTVKITQGGDFTVTGTLENGMILVNTDSKVKLRLSNANISNSSGPAIYFEDCKKGYITIKKDTEN
ncbi:MAG: carbohydrate-binding domain-containing protein, partial [Oscillospiraceae bacterium]|nr:carbohydrate-binding domain-containing protein [Oscillospiraceae bacterium]